MVRALCGAADERRRRGASERGCAKSGCATAGRAVERVRGNEGCRVLWRGVWGAGCRVARAWRRASPGAAAAARRAHRWNGWGVRFGEDIACLARREPRTPREGRRRISVLFDRGSFAGQERVARMV